MTVERNVDIRAPGGFGQPVTGEAICKRAATSIRSPLKSSLLLLDTYYIVLSVLVSLCGIL